MTHALVVLDIGLTMGLIFVPVALSMMLSLRCLDFPDLTVEASFPLGAAVCALAIGAGVAAGGALILGAIAGALAGTVTALIQRYVRLSKLLAGVIVLTMFYSITLRVMGASNISLLGSETVFDRAASWDVSVGFGARLHPALALLLLALVAATAIGLEFFLGTVWGLRLQAVGNNELFARDMGIASSAYVIGGLAAANTLVAMSGGLLAMHQGFADVGMGQGILVVGIASIAIGERIMSVARSIGRIKALLAAAFVGSILYQLAVVGALRLGLAASDLKLATAIIVLAVMATQYARSRGVSDAY
jgi:putative tryptophan/tyrosine transport system permease protein